MAIDRNTIVSIPENAYVEKDQTVFVKDLNVYDPLKKYYRVKHTTIGRRISEGKMYPNTTYAKRYPLLYEQASGQKLRRRTINTGFYISVLAIATKLRLYEILEKCFGIENANMILDFNMYSMIFHSCIADQYPSSMKDQMIFSNSLWSPSKLSAFFKTEFTEPRISEFKRLWAQHCMDKGVSDVWIAIDGSNNDCQISETKLGEHGKPKSHKNVHVVSYMYVVDATTGDPISIFIYRGGRVDCKAVMEVIGWLKAYDIHTKGVIVDRGFATEDVFREFDRNGIEYVAMLKGNSLAHTTMLSEYSDTIRMKYEFMLGKYRHDKDVSKETPRSDSPILYGTSSTEKIKIFASHSYKAYTHLIFDRQNGGERQDTWYRKVTEKAYSLQSELKSGKRVRIPDEFNGCIIKTKIDGEETILVNESQVQATGDRKGYFTLASSSRMEAEETNNIYSLRNSSEEIYSMLKSQIGADVTGVHGDDSIVAKLFVAFITSIIRNEILKTAQSFKIPTNKIIKELDSIKLFLDNEDKYYVCHTENEREINFLRYWDFEPDMLDGLATMLNERSSVKEPDPHHKLPEHKQKIRRGPGRPTGSKNILPKPKKKSSSAEDIPARRRGRPKGSKNKKTIEREMLTAKRGPGRPKGAKNKPKPTGEIVKRKRGRPRKEKI